MPSLPSVPPERAFLTRRPFAHRGLHGAGVVENSRAGFAAAIAGGYGIELDVRTSRDGVAFVFHDDRLERLTGEAGQFAARDAAALDAVRLSGTDEPLPRLAEVLALVGDRAPLLIELKTGHGRAGALCRAVDAALAGHPGAAAVMSFDPDAMRWFALHRPRRARGLVVSGQARDLRVCPRRAALARPHFIACDIRDLPSALTRRMQARGRPVLTWTVRTAADRTRAAAHADQLIFEDAAA